MVITELIVSCYLHSIEVVHNDRKKLLLLRLKEAAETDTSIIFKFCVFVDIEEMQISPKEQKILNPLSIVQAMLLKP